MASIRIEFADYHYFFCLLLFANLQIDVVTHSITSLRLIARANHR